MLSWRSGPGTSGEDRMRRLMEGCMKSCWNTEFR